MCLNLRIYGSDIMRKIFSVTFALIVLLSFATSVQALEYKTIQRDNGASASAWCSRTDGNLITDTFLSATESHDGTDIYLDYYTWDATTGYTVDDEHGYMFTTVDVFSIDKKLNSASLSEVPINLYNFDTGEVKTVNVKAEWTGTGEISRGSYTSVSTSGDYRFKGTSSSNSRTATATVSLNNKDLGQTNGNLYNFKSAYIQRTYPQTLNSLSLGGSSIGGWIPSPDNNTTTGPSI
jgi:hypothetical protein